MVDNYVNGWNALAAAVRPLPVELGADRRSAAIIGNLISCSLAAYAFAGWGSSARSSSSAIMLLTIMLPIHVIIVPQYMLFSQLGWVNTFLPLIVPKLLATDAFFVFLMVQFIRGIPRELDEAARIDGAGHPRIFVQIILPLMVPALATTAIFTFIWTWNDFFAQLIYLTKPELYTVPLALRAFDGCAERNQLRRDVRDECRVPSPDLPDLPVRPEVPPQGDRDDGNQMSIDSHKPTDHRFVLITPHHTQQSDSCRKDA